MIKLAVPFLFLFLVSCNQEKDKALHSQENENTVNPAAKPVAVEFKTLSNFELPIPDPGLAEKQDIKFILEALPKDVLQLHNKKVTIQGFMMPLVFNKEERIVTFLLTQDQGACCFGKVPDLNDFIFCTSKTAYPDLRDVLLEVNGTLKTKPSFNGKDEAVYLYTMKIESIKELKVMPPFQRPGISF